MKRFEMSRRTRDRKTQGLVAAVLVTAALTLGAGTSARESSASSAAASGSAGVLAPGVTAEQRLVAAAVSPRVAQAVRALRTAAKRVPNGRPYDLEWERHRGQAVWEIEVASGKQRPYELRVSANGQKVVRVVRLRRPSVDALRVAGARVSLAGALLRADRRATGLLSEAEIDRTRAGVLVWEVSFDRPGDQETEVIVHAITGKVILINTRHD